MGYGFVDKDILAKLKLEKAQRRRKSVRIANKDAIMVFEKYLKSHIRTGIHPNIGMTVIGP